MAHFPTHRTAKASQKLTNARDSNPTTPSPQITTTPPIDAHFRTSFSPSPKNLIRKLEDLTDDTEREDAFLNPEENPFLEEEDHRYTVCHESVSFDRNGGTDWVINDLSILPRWYTYQADALHRLKQGVKLSTHMHDILAISSCTLLLQKPYSMAYLSTFSQATLDQMYKDCRADLMPVPTKALHPEIMILAKKWLQVCWSCLLINGKC